MDAAIRSAEQAFFSSLLTADTGALERLLAEDFVLIDVILGAELSKTELVSALETGQVRFDLLEPGESRVRIYGDAAIVTGSTRMEFRFGQDETSLRSRYTHVYARIAGEWRLVGAQGTPIRTS